MSTSSSELPESPATVSISTPVMDREWRRPRERGEERPQKHKKPRKRDREGEASQESEDEEKKKKKKGKKRIKREDKSVELMGLAELERYVPDVHSRAQYEVIKMLKYDLKRFREFHRKGVAVRWGRFTSEENQQLARNVDDFLELTGISSATMLFFPERFGDEAAEVKALRSRHCLFERIADGIPRTCHSVYNKAVKTYNQHNYMGRFTEEELKDLKKLQTRYGNNWKIISQKMDRSAQALQKRYSQLANSHGPWGSDELSRLLQAVQDHVEGPVPGAAGRWVSKEQLSNNLPWKDISCQVQTRSWTQCREKWLLVLNQKIAPRGRLACRREMKNLQAKIDLINTLYNMNMDDVADINWDNVADIIGKAKASYIQMVYCRLKITHVPNWANLSNCKIIDFLWEKIIPELKLKLVKIREKDVEEEEEEEEEQQQEDRKQYLFTDIFSQEDDTHLDVSQLDDTTLD